jgi:hypothetical protein
MRKLLRDLPRRTKYPRANRIPNSHREPKPDAENFQ